MKIADITGIVKLSSIPHKSTASAVAPINPERIHKVVRLRLLVSGRHASTSLAISSGVRGKIMPYNKYEAITPQQNAANEPARDLLRNNLGVRWPYARPKDEAAVSDQDSRSTARTEMS